ncbi:hypothetical protein SY83_20440 [Paenibacillus swuensis]|uniref:Uncharacterized protein n=1 Tax=Paenibacillus swuensis TaxID=1178515 RepID=A0A172TND6_9BACL|nr:hypothetical protein [Paenibacillus swuensis]ANE48263.1 hypothetical protein SY83_20440 [Paenibacillus swuensis]
MDDMFGQFEWIYRYAEVNKVQLTLLLLNAAGLFTLWYTYWKTRFIRLMRTTFERSNLYVTVTKPNKKVRKLYPRLTKLSDQDDPEYFVFEYAMPIGMTVKSFEEKKKHFETAFDAKALVSGEGLMLSIKIKKEKLIHSAA